ncbi:MAG: histidine kinase, partial [Rubripirellula sp.]|nr:histidine kinase [Rubripirellula sp.]
IGSVGVTPTLKKAIFDALEKNYSLKLPNTPGLDTLACMEAAAQSQMSLGIFLGGNLYGSNPDSRFADESLSKLDMSVMLNTTLNTGHVHGLAKETYILPVLARDEEPAATTQESMFNFVRLSDGGPKRLMGPRSELEIIAEIGSRLSETSSKIDWKSMREPERVRHWIGSVVPGYEQIKNIGQSRSEFQIEGRTVHSPVFATENGRAQLHIHTLPPLLANNEHEFRLMTVRSEGQFNTVVYEEEDLYRNQDGRDVILIHPDDLSLLSLKHNQRVVVNSKTGTMENIRVRSYEKIRKGNALMYYPEANVLVSRDSDPASRTPAFKGVVVTITPET